MTRLILFLTLFLALGCKKSAPETPPAPHADQPMEAPSDPPSATPGEPSAPPGEPSAATTAAEAQPQKPKTAPSKPATPRPDAPAPATSPDAPNTPQAKSIPRFRNVSVRKASEGSYLVMGEAMVFEATFGYVVEDGHHELASGFGTASAGAPAWGKFSFNLEVTKRRPDSTLHLVLYESSPRDGSRQHEFAVRLP